MAEELKSQLAEQVPGALQVFSKALGMSTKDMFKAMENGELMARDVLPLVAEQFKLGAREGGAFTQMLATNRVKMMQLVTTFKMFKNTIFKAGFKDGLNYLFDSFKLMLEVLSPLAKVIGGALNVAIKGLIFPFRMVAAIVADLSHYLNEMFEFFGFESRAELGEYIIKIASLALGFYTLSKAVNMVTTAIKALTSLKIVQWLGRLAIAGGAAVGALPAIGVGAAATAGGIVVNRTLEEQKQGMGFLESMGKRFTEMVAPMVPGLGGANLVKQAVDVNITVDDSEFGKAVQARIVENEQGMVNRTKERFSN